MERDRIERIIQLLENRAPEFVHKPARNLVNRLDEMNKYKGTGIHGADNYYHRLAMCENAQMGFPEMVVSLGGGLAKEAVDIYCKTRGECGEKKIGFIEAVKDSAKDMGNNIGGSFLGLPISKKNCKLLLENLDWETNTWKEPRK